MSKIVNTDNFGGDYPAERFLEVGERLSQEDAQAIADILNKYGGTYAPRFWKVVADDYKLQPGFEP